jgi:hypothetical protein
MIQPRSGTAAYANGTDVEGTGRRLFRLGDRSFGACVDGLILVDLLRTDTKVLSRYMGKQGVAQLHARHGTVAQS